MLKLRLCIRIMVFKKRKHISILFLLIYFFSISPDIRFHYHDYQVAEFADADSCERAIFYGNNTEDINHPEHFTSDLNRCLLDVEYFGVALNSEIRVADISSFNESLFISFYKPGFYQSYSGNTSGRSPPVIV